MVDPTGQKPFPDDCRSVREPLDYAECVRDFYQVSTTANRGDPFTPLSAHQVPFGKDMEYIINGIIQGVPGCWLGEVPYRTKGYLEGWSAQGGVFIQAILGKELVYDFATMEREAFAYTGSLASINISIGSGFYFGEAYGLRSYSTLKDDYSGAFSFWYGGIGVGPSSILPFRIGPSISIGILHDWGVPDGSVGGWASYHSISVGLSIPVEGGGGKTDYFVMTGYDENYYIQFPAVGGPSSPRKSLRAALYHDISRGLPGLDIFDVSPLNQLMRRLIGIPLARKYADVFDGIHFDSYYP